MMSLRLSAVTRCWGVLDSAVSGLCLPLTSLDILKNWTSPSCISSASLLHLFCISGHGTCFPRSHAVVVLSVASCYLALAC